jgi:Domain of unknown function (DUF397)
MHMNVWFKSSRSGPDGACVETFFDGNHIHIRHSKTRYVTSGNVELALLDSDECMAFPVS